SPGCDPDDRPPIPRGRLESALRPICRLHRFPDGPERESLPPRRSSGSLPWGRCDAAYSMPPPLSPESARRPHRSMLQPPCPPTPRQYGGAPRSPRVIPPVSWPRPHPFGSECPIPSAFPESFHSAFGEPPEAIAASPQTLDPFHPENTRARGSPFPRRGN